MQSPEYEKRYKDPQTGAVRRNVLFRGVYQGVWSVVLSTIPACMPFFDCTNYVLGVTDNGGCSRSILHNLRSSKIHPRQYLDNNTRPTIKPKPARDDQPTPRYAIPSHAYRPRDCVFVSGDGFLFDADTGGGAEAECAGGSNE